MSPALLATDMCVFARLEFNSINSVIVLAFSFFKLQKVNSHSQTTVRKLNKVLDNPPDSKLKDNNMMLVSLDNPSTFLREVTQITVPWKTS